MTTTTTHRTRSGALKFSLAAVAAVALTIGSASPTFAADEQVGPADVASYENGEEGSSSYNYDQWHVGSVDNPNLSVEDSLTFNECSVTTLAVPQGPQTVTQVLKGFPITNRPTANSENGTTDLESLINSISIDVAQGQVSIQLPMFMYYGGDRSFTTVRNISTFGPGVHTLSDEMLTDSRTHFEADPYNLAHVALFMNENIEEYDAMFEILGVGFTGSPDAEINSISFGGDTYFFGTGDCMPTPPVVDEEDEAPVPPTRVDTGL